LAPRAEDRVALRLRGLLCVAMPLLAACATTPPSADPRAVRRLDPAELARTDAARPGRPLALDEIVRRSREGLPTAELLDILRSTGTHHALSPSEVLRLREQGVAPEVLDALAEAQARHDRDQATADKVRQQTEQAAAVERARAEAYRRGLREGYPAYPYGTIRYGYPQPFGFPYYGPGPRWGRGGLQWGIGIGR
jgi:hypothetical protein